MGAELSHDHELVADCMMDANVKMNLVQTLKTNGFNKLADLLVERGVALPPGSHTIFAPTDAAFAAANLAGVTDVQLLNVLKFHVVPNRLLCKETLVAIIDQDDDSDQHALDTWYTGRHLWVKHAEGGGVHIMAASIVNANMFFSNGVKGAKGVHGIIHGIDKVLLPCGNSVATLEQALDNQLRPALLNTLRELKLYALLTTPSAMFTLFAPPDMELTAALYKDGKLKVSKEDAVTALKSHAVHGCFTKATILHMLSGAEKSISIQNLAGECLKFVARGEQLYVENAKGERIEIRDEVQHANGVVHVVTDVLSSVHCDEKSIKKRKPRAR